MQSCIAESSHSDGDPPDHHHRGHDILGSFGRELLRARERIDAVIAVRTRTTTHGARKRDGRHAESPGARRNLCRDLTTRCLAVDTLCARDVAQPIIAYMRKFMMRFEFEINTCVGS
jgi:hypothetical protein